MKATYNTAGQMVAEKWTNWFNAAVAHYKYTYDGQGNIVRSLDLTAKKEYTYTYEGGKLVRAQEYDVTLSDEIVTGRTIANTVAYFYDSEDRLYKKTISLTGQTIHYENPEDGNTVVKFTAGGKTVTSHSKNDSFGRKVFDELQLGTGIVTREFRYHAGEETERHAAEGKMKSAPTTQLVSQIVLSDGRTIAYEYDAEERITKVTDSVDGVTEYTYDALGQLLTETRDGEVVNAMTYDNYGNILTKNGVVYTYGTGAYKDDLMQVDGVWVFHDEQGNPTYYQGHNLSWEKGRQLKSFDGNTYAYNANGIRTHKTVSGIPHVYTLDGTKILHEDWGGNSIVPLYDNEDSVCGLVYDTTYYFQKNLQGDIIAITDQNGEVVARYRYDAWGVPTITMDVTPINIATVNPFRYRGYYYDTDTGLYYLQSRYYDPVVGRFINADEVIFLGANGNIASYNLFAYCENDPVFRIDIDGCWYYTLNDYYNIKIYPWVRYRIRSNTYNVNHANYMTYVQQYMYNAGTLGEYTGYIDSQSNRKFANLKLGYSTVKNAGCETIAIYNIMKALSKNPYYPDVINECNMNGLLWLSGLWGIWPPNMKKYFNAHAVNYTYYSNKKTFFNKLNNAKLAIVSYWNKGAYSSSLHTVALIKKTDNKWKIYNTSKSLSDIEGKRFICGYIF